VKKARELRPDVITMDINMPECDGITGASAGVGEGICPVIMVSSLTQRGAVTTFEAMELGAFDYVAKPKELFPPTEQRRFGSDREAEVRSAGRHTRKTTSAQPKARNAEVTIPSERRPVTSSFGYKAVAIGISTGGPSTLGEVLPFLPRIYRRPFFLVQHMPAKFMPAFAERLNRNCQIQVVLAEAGMTVQPGTCYVAKGGCQLGLLRRLNGDVVIRTPTFPKTLFMPSVTEMMRSVHSVFGSETVGVLMTGIGDDGADMMVRIVSRVGRRLPRARNGSGLWHAS
jgi:two-component system chemotaxis response regulator CheB